MQKVEPRPLSSTCTRNGEWCMFVVVLLVASQNENESVTSAFKIQEDSRFVADVSGAPAGSRLESRSLCCVMDGRMRFQNRVAVNEPLLERS